MPGKITIVNRSEKVTEIHIEGLIGIPEKIQFDRPEERVSTYETFQETLRRIGALRSETIVVNIRSTGGNVNDALLIYDALTQLNADVVTRCYGYVASAATVVAQAAAPGKREISRNALYLIHQSSSCAEGNSGDLAQTIDLLDKTNERIASIYAAASGKKAASFMTLMSENNGNGRWLSAQEVVEKGLADRIIPAREISNDALDALTALNLPPVPQHLHPSGRVRKIRKHWNRILDLLRFSNNVENESSEPEPVTTDREEDPLSALEEQIARYENPTVYGSNREITNLQRRIVELETLNAKLRAKATQTLPKEDPDHRESRRGGNAAAYENDIKNFLTH